MRGWGWRGGGECVQDWPGTRKRAAGLRGRASGRVTHARAAAALRAAAAQTAQSACQPATRRIPALAQLGGHGGGGGGHWRKVSAAGTALGSGTRLPRGQGPSLGPGGQRRGLVIPLAAASSGPAAGSRGAPRSPGPLCPGRTLVGAGAREVSESDPGRTERPLDPRAEGQPHCCVSGSAGRRRGGPGTQSRARRPPSVSFGAAAARDSVPALVRRGGGDRRPCT